jgi:2-isopropylmalate synthase
MIGLNQNQLILGKHSGRHAFSEKIKEMGHVLTKEELDIAFAKFKDLADSKKDVMTEDIEAILFEDRVEKIYSLKRVSVSTGNKRQPKAKIKLSKQGEILEAEGSGAGAVDAIYKTINQLIGEDINLVDYSIQAITGGTDALGNVTVRIKDQENIFVARGSSTDILVASTRAYLKAINKLLISRKQRRLKADL